MREVGFQLTWVFLESGTWIKITLLGTSTRYFSILVSRPGGKIPSDPYDSHSAHPMVQTQRKCERDDNQPRGLRSIVVAGNVGLLDQKPAQDMNVMQPVDKSFTRISSLTQPEWPCERPCLGQSHLCRSLGCKVGATVCLCKPLQIKSVHHKGICFVSHNPLSHFLFQLRRQKCNSRFPVVWHGHICKQVQGDVMTVAWIDANLKNKVNWRAADHIRLASTMFCMPMWWPKVISNCVASQENSKVWDQLVSVDLHMEGRCCIFVFRILDGSPNCSKRLQFFFCVVLHGKTDSCSDKMPKQCLSVWLCIQQKSEQTNAWSFQLIFQHVAKDKWCDQTMHLKKRTFHCTWDHCRQTFQMAPEEQNTWSSLQMMMTTKEHKGNHTCTSMSPKNFWSWTWQDVEDWRALEVFCDRQVQHWTRPQQLEFKTFNHNRLT